MTVAKTRIKALFSRSRIDIDGICMISQCLAEKCLFNPLSGIIWISNSGVSSIKRSVKDAFLSHGRGMPLRPSTILVTPDKRENSEI